MAINLPQHLAVRIFTKILPLREGVCLEEFWQAAAPELSARRMVSPDYFADPELIHELGLSGCSYVFSVVEGAVNSKFSSAYGSSLNFPAFIFESSPGLAQLINHEVSLIDAQKVLDRALAHAGAREAV